MSAEPDTTTPEVRLEVSGIRKQFPGVVALDDVSLRLRAGEIHALLGENGAGKSTLIKILTGVYQPDEGEIRLDSSPVRFASPRSALATGISVVHQERNLIPQFTVAENILLERIPIVPLYFAANRPVVERDGALIMVDDDRMVLQPGERPVVVGGARQGRHRLDGVPLVQEVLDRPEGGRCGDVRRGRERTRHEHPHRSAFRECSIRSSTSAQG